MRNTVGCVCLILCLVNVPFAKEWRGIVPLHSTRAEVKKLFGKPLFEENSVIDVYDVDDGRINIMYVRQRCERGLPANWGNWNVPVNTVVEITVNLKKPSPFSDLKIQDKEKF
jgi:hypothetical protein